MLRADVPPSARSEQAMEERKADPNELFDIEEAVVDAVTAFRGPKARYLYDWWAAHAGGDLPRRRDFDIVEHRPIVANIFVVDCLTDGNFVFRLLGEEAIRIIGRNRTGETLMHGAVGMYGHALHEYYVNVVRGRRCMKCVGSLRFHDANIARFESIDCPLADDDGRVGRIVGVMELLDAPR
jgi:hypothetical protein